MPTKEELVEQLKVLASTSQYQPNSWVEKLKDFLGVLKDGFPDVAGEVEDSDVRAPVMHVRLWPSYRPLESSYMISVALQGTGAVVLGADRVACATPDDLWNYLVKFLSLEAFRSTLLEYRRRNNEAVVGFLRTGAHAQLLQEDVAVVVEADTVKQIADAKAGPFRVAELPGSTYSAFSEPVKYNFLTAAGFTLAVTDVKRGTASPPHLLVDGALRDDLRP